MTKTTDKRRQARSGFRGRTHSGSAILARLGTWSSRVFWSFEHGLFGKLFCGGDETDRALESTLAVRAVQAAGLGDRVAKPYKKVVAEGAASSRLFAFADRFRAAFLLTRVRFFGIVGLLFSLYSLAGFFLYQYFSFSYSRTSVGDLILGAVVLAGSAFLLFVGRTTGEVLSGSRLFGRLFIGVLGIDPGSLRTNGEDAQSHGALAFVAGTALGIAGIFLYPHRIVLWSVQLILALVILAVPESGLLSAILVLPLCPTSVTASLAAATLVSYLVKLIRLKRTFRLRMPEVMMLLTVFSVFLASRGGFSGGESAETLWTCVLFGALWILSVNLIKTGTLFRKFVAALMYGGLLTLFLTGTGFLLTALHLDAWASLIPDTVLDRGVLEMFVVFMVPVTLLHGSRWSGMAMLTMIALNAYFLQSMWVWLGLLLAVLVWGVFARRALFASVLAGGLTVPMFIVAFGDRLAGFTVRMSAAAAALARRYWFCGHGTGRQALLEGAAAFGLVPDGFAMNLYGRLILEGGLPHLLVFLLAALFSLQYVFTAVRNAESPNAKALCGGVAAAVVMFLLCGFVTDVGSDLRVVGIFWCLCAAASMSKSLYGRVPDGR
ncbi:MAG: hypothetical protein ILO68_02660 [Clostridia bacterium]|nr:hypothetical protein [Clostridia bacterium]